MANLGRNFDSTQYDDMNAGFEPIPAGKYKAAVVESKMKRTKQDDGQYLELKLEVLEGEYKGRNVFTRLNLENPNKTAVEIATRELATICRAANKIYISESEELHHIPIEITVKIEEGRGGYGPSNKVTMYEPIGGNAQKEQPAAPAGNQNKKPWE